MTDNRDIAGWGMPVFDAEGVPALRYRFVPHLHPPGAGELGSSCFVAGNHAVKVLGTSDGLFFPYVMSGDVVSLCGDPRGAPHGGGRLFLVEGGQAKPVVGPNHGSADHSDTVTAEYRYAPGYIEKAFAVGKLFIRYRLALPWVHIPAMVLLYIVENRGEGNRWVTLEDVWDLAPCVLDARLMKSGLGQRLVSAMGFGGKGAWNNSYFKPNAQMAGQKAVVQFVWEEGKARKLGRKEPYTLPNIVAMPLSKNVAVTVNSTPDSLKPALGAEDRRRTSAASARVCATARFTSRPGELQIGATCFWLGDWEEGKRQVRRLLPISMFPGNESILWKKRAPLRLESRDTSAGKTLDWESQWAAGITYASLWRDLADETRLTVAGDGSQAFVSGHPADRLVTSAVVAAMSHQLPELAAELYVPWARRLCDRMAVRPREWKNSGYDLEDLLYTLWAGCELVAASGDAQGEARQVVEKLSALGLETLEQAELYGPSHLFVANWFWKDGFVGDKRVSDKRLVLESVYLTAMAAAVFSWAASELESSASVLADGLASHVLKLVGFLDSIGKNGRFPRWIATNGSAPDDARILDHYVWLLFLPLEPKTRKAILQLLRERMAEANVSGLNDDTMETTSESPEEAESDERIGRRSGPLLNALLLWSLGRSDPAAALWLYRTTGIDSLLRDFPDGPSTAFGPGAGYPGGPESAIAPFGAGPDVATWFNHLALCRTLATLKLFGIGPDSGGLYVRAYLLNQFSLDTGVLHLSQSGEKVRGCWNGPGATVKLILDFDGLHEGTRWVPETPDAVVSSENRGYALVLTVRSGKTWVLARG